MEAHLQSKTMPMGIQESSPVKNGMAYMKAIMMNNDPSHDYFHVGRVLKNALYIARMEQCTEPVDLQVVALSAIFHDIVDFKYDYSANRSLEELSREKLNGFFGANRISKERQDKIIYIVNNISFRKELENTNIHLPVELRIVRDADRLDAIGAIGIARCFGYSCKVMRPFHDPTVNRLQNITAEEYNNQVVKNTSTAYTHIYEKLLNLKDRMCTVTGKELAQNRHDFMVSFLKQFDDENSLE